MILCPIKVNIGVFVIFGLLKNISLIRYRLHSRLNMKAQNTKTYNRNNHS